MRITQCLSLNWQSRCWWRLRHAPPVSPSAAASLRTTAQTQALKDQMRIMQQQMQELQKQIDALSQQTTDAAAAAAAPAAPKAPTPRSPEKRRRQSAGGAEVREVHQGLLRHARRVRRRHDQGHETASVAYPWALRRSDQSQPGLCARSRQRGRSTTGGQVGWQPDLSTNKSVHRLPRLAQDPGLHRRLHLSGRGAAADHHVRRG